MVSILPADVLGLPVMIPHSAEPAVGMGILARTGSVTAAAARMAGEAVRIERDQAGGEGLAENFGRFVTALVERGCVPEDPARRARA